MNDAKTITIPIERYKELLRLTFYFHRGNGDLNCGSEVDRLKGIIHDLDRKWLITAKERNACAEALQKINPSIYNEIRKRFQV